MTAQIHFYDLHPEPADMRAEVLDGLSRPQKRISPKFFYDQQGSRLFDAITELPEYYPTRTEIRILERHGAEMAELVGREALLVELGSGSSLKIRVLLEALKPAVYMPVDISRNHLLESARALASSFPGLEVHAACADYSSPFDLPVDVNGAERAAFFPGSSIGNFDPGEARRFLERIGTLLGPGGKLLVGVDLIKDAALLNAAYNDAQGVTADFNLNLLKRINRELGADFDLDAFRHWAYYNDTESRVEMHLVSRGEQRVQVAGEGFQFGEGESIHTENSYKYSVDGFHALAGDAGFEPERLWTDEDGLFSVHCLRFRGQ
ncbi:MAG: L-histidine N(alpha)-methyltransferase [Pseudomonadota bacterium]|nr:L-histidine N(alpha)-methyltransferase [Pseudomonadota bacterium]